MCADEFMGIWHATHSFARTQTHNLGIRMHSSEIEHIYSGHEKGVRPLTHLNCSECISYVTEYTGRVSLNFNQLPLYLIYICVRKNDIACLRKCCVEAVVLSCGNKIWQLATPS